MEDIQSVYLELSSYGITYDLVTFPIRSVPSPILSNRRLSDHGNKTVPIISVLINTLLIGYGKTKISVFFIISPRFSATMGRQP